MLAEPHDLPAAVVLDAVRAGWDARVDRVEHAPVGTAAFHWCAGDEAGPRWFVTVEPLPEAEDRDGRRDAYAASAQLSATLEFVLGPVPGPGLGGEAAHPIEPHYLLSVAPWVEGSPAADPVTGSFPDDAARSEVAAMLARLHTARRPRGIPTWEPRIGWRTGARRARLERARSATMWEAGPLAAPAWRVMTGAATLLDRAVRRLDLLAAAASGTASAWVPTHGEPHAANVLVTAGGPRLTDWATLAVAPVERDLRHVLLDADGSDPELAYLASGGVARPLSPDVLELFALEWQLAVVARAADLFSGPHLGGEDDERLLEQLDAALSALADGWG